MRQLHYLFVFTLLLLASRLAFGQSLDELLKAVHSDDAAVVGELLDRGLAADTTDKDGNTILMTAARLGYRDLVALLIARKATVNRRNPFGDSALMVACLNGHLGIVKLLAEHGAEINPSGWTPLAYAAFGGNPAVVRFLLEKGADKNAVEPNGYTPLMLAIRNGNASAARELLYADVDLEHTAPDGATALRLASKGGNSGMVELLKRAGATK